MTSTNEGLIRQDRLGRFRFSKEQREALLDAFESSGMSGTSFATAHGVKYQTFATWVQKRKQPAASPSADRPLAPALCKRGVKHRANDVARQSRSLHSGRLLLRRPGVRQLAGP